MKLFVSSATDKGMCRPHNEDMGMVQNEMVCDEPVQMIMDTGGDSPIVLAVADGMGGYNGGEVASQLAIEHLMDWRNELSADADFDIASASMKAWAAETDKIIRECGDAGKDLKGMGTTLVGVCMTQNCAMWFNVGDSRLYRLRDGWLRQLSKDHSIRNLRRDPTLPANIIYNSMGNGKEFFVDVDEITNNLKNGDVLMLCSDGLCDMLDDDKIEALLKENASPQRMIECANNEGGKDNITVVIARIVIEAPREELIQNNAVEE